MRIIKCDLITRTIRDLCIAANKELPSDLVHCIDCAEKKEGNPTAKSVLQDLGDNLVAAKELNIPICQDTGMAVVFAEVGQDVQIVGDAFEDAVNEGVRQGYTQGLLRCSVVADPLHARVNTGDNTPAILHTRIVPGDQIKLTVAPKGFGSENMSQIKMFTPSATREDVIQFVLQVVLDAGSNPCPPVVVGIGIGGDFEQCALYSKTALCRDVSVRNKDAFYHTMEEELLERVNALGIGPQGFGGATTALAVNIEVCPTHIAGLPIAVNMGCHVTRHQTKKI